MKKKAVEAPRTPSWEVYLLPMGLLPASLIFMNSLNDPASLPRLIVWSAVLLGWGVYQGLKDHRQGNGSKLPMSWLLSAGLLLVAGLVSIAVAHNLAEAMLVWLRWGMLIASCVAAIRHVQEHGQKGIEAWAIAIAGAAGLQALVGLSETGGAQPLEGTLANPNLYGGFLGAAVPIMVGLAFLGGQGWMRMSAWACLAMTVLALYLSESRTALLMLLVEALVFMPLGIRLVWRAAGWAKWRPILVGLLVAMPVIVAGVIYTAGWKRKEMPRSLGQLVDDDSRITLGLSSAEVRFVLWNKSIQMAKERPMTGCGLGNWKLEVPRYGVQGYDAQGRYGLLHYTHAHNEYLHLAAETGLLGLLGLLGFLLLPLVAGLSGGGVSGGWALAGSIAVVGVMVDAFFGFPMERVEHGILLAGGLALAFSSWRGRSLAAGWGRAVSGFTLAMAGAGLILALLRVGPEQASKRVRDAKESKQWEVLIQEAKVADTYLHRYEGQSATPFQWYAARAEVELGLRSDVASYPGMQNKEYARHMEAALANVKEGLELAPHNLPLLSELGSTLSFMGRHTDAVSAYMDLLGRFPDHDDAWVNLGICYYFLNQPEEIRAALSHVSPRCAHPRLEDLRRSL